MADSYRRRGIREGGEGREGSGEGVGEGGHLFLELEDMATNGAVRRMPEIVVSSSNAAPTR